MNHFLPRYRDVLRMSITGKKLTEDRFLSYDDGGTKGSTVVGEQKRVSEFPRDDVAGSSHAGVACTPLPSVTLYTRADAKHIFAHFAAVSGWCRQKEILEIFCKYGPRDTIYLRVDVCVQTLICIQRRVFPAIRENPRGTSR